MANKKIEFVAKDVNTFSAWIKKFSSVDKGLLLEIDEPGGRFLAKTYNAEHSVVKLSSIDFDSAGFTVKPSKDPKRVKVGIYNIVRMMKIMDQFDNEEFSFTVNWDDVNYKNVIEFTGLSLVLKNKSLKITVDCTSLDIFGYISDELFTDTISAIDEILTEFDLSKEAIEQINQLCSLEDDKFLEFKNGANVYLSGKAFELLLKELPGEHDGSENTIDLFKDQFANVDVEDYAVQMDEDKLVFTSEDKLSITVLSEVVKD
jgi:hypothetical protein